mmetsp:Transcript_12012/g.19295  ORF Transcript_12012/g.19295 Transcript_12012/m.19295 type:complete len:1206 (-) Transcript_12012:575-4192(-)
MATEEEKKLPDSPEKNKHGDNPSSTMPAPSNANLKPRTSQPPEPFVGNTALEHLFSPDTKPGDTVKKKNMSPPRPPQHQRGVSWDLGIPDIRQATMKQQPSMSNHGKSPGGMPSGGRPPVVGGSNRNVNMMHPKPPTVTRKTSNNDSSLGSSNSYSPKTSPSLKSSYSAPSKLELEASAVVDELHAETNLMRHLDETDPLRPRAGTGMSMMSDVPLDEAEHNFVIEGGPSNLARSTSGSNHDGSATRSSKIATEKKQSNRKVAAAKAHRRQLTVEQALFGLTSALTEMKANDRSDRDRKSHERGDTASSRDMFEVAGLLYDRHHKRDVSANKPVEDKAESKRRVTTQEDNTPHVQNTTAAKRWGAVKTNLAELKKTDGDHGVDLSKNEDIEEGQNEESAEMDDSLALSGDSEDEQEPSERKSRFLWMKKRKRVNPFRHLPYANKVKEEWEVFNNFLRPRKSSLYTYVKIILMYIMIPSALIAAILFYLAGNPPDGKCPNPNVGCAGASRKARPSASWWVLFIGCREVVILCLSKLTESFVIDFLALRTQSTLRLFGPMFTLLLVQWKGWPFLLFCFGMYNFALIVGDSPFSNHWLYWQSWIDMCNRANPPGFVTSSQEMYRLCATAMGVGAAVAVKRVVIGIYLGRKTFSSYSKQLTSVMNKMLMLNEISRFAKAIEEQSWASSRNARPSIFPGSLPGARRVGSSGMKTSQVSDERLNELLDLANQQELQELEGDNMTFTRARSMKSTENGTVDDMEKVIDPDDRDPYTGGLSMVQRQRINDLLGQWEEPAHERTSAAEEVASIGAFMQFKRALNVMDTALPFGGAFGVADRRSSCIECSQELYDRLMLKGSSVSGELHFNIIAVIAMDKDGDLDTEKTKELIRLFRPNRDGTISLVDFVRSIDSVYKELRLLRATIAGSMKIDKALESIFNYGFYAILACVILWALNIDPLALFLSLSSIVLAFAFMIGTASSKYFEGLLLIIVQRPYGIGDRVNISNPEVPGDAGGAQGWIVEDVTLFTTTLCLAATSERATISNGMLAKSRIINGARSPNAIVYVVMRFGIETPYRKIEVFKSAVERFVHARPREWSSLLGFRVSRIEADQGFIEYTAALMHRERWQNIVPILNSRNTMHAYCLELAKKLDMRYKNPPLPVDLRMPGQVPPQFELKYNHDALAGEIGDPTHSPGQRSVNSDSLAQVAAMFDD